MEEINLKEMFDYFLSKKLYIILITVVCILTGFVYFRFFKVPMYKSYTTILLTKGSDVNQITSNDITLNKNLVDTYREIIKSRKVINKVINNLNIDYNFESLSKEISVSSINDTEIIKISVSDRDSKIATDVANETANVFNSEVVKLYNIQNIGIVDEAVEEESPYNINMLKTLLISFFIGIILSFGAVFILFYFDTTIKSIEEVEKKLELPVIGEVPTVGGKHE